MDQLNVCLDGAVGKYLFKETMMTPEQRSESSFSVVFLLALNRYFHAGFVYVVNNILGRLFYINIIFAYFLKEIRVFMRMFMRVF